MNQQSRDYCY